MCPQTPTRRETGPPYLQPCTIYGSTLIILSSSLPSSPLDLSSLSLWSFVFIHVHLLSPCFSYSLLWALLLLCYSTRFPLSLSSVPLFCIPPTHFLSSWQAVCSSVNNNYGQCCKNKCNWITRQIHKDYHSTAYTLACTHLIKRSCRLFWWIPD